MSVLHLKNTIWDILYKVNICNSNKHQHQLVTSEYNGTLPTAQDVKEVVILYAKDTIHHHHHHSWQTPFNTLHKKYFFVSYTTSIVTSPILTPATSLPHPLVSQIILWFSLFLLTIILTNLWISINYEYCCNLQIFNPPISMYPLLFSALRASDLDSFGLVLNKLDESMRYMEV